MTNQLEVVDLHAKFSMLLNSDVGEDPWKYQENKWIINQINPEFFLEVQMTTNYSASYTFREHVLWEIYNVKNVGRNEKKMSAAIQLHEMVVIMEKPKNQVWDRLSHREKSI